MVFDNSGTNDVWAAQLRTIPHCVNCNFSWPHLDKSYVVRKLLISEASICSFSMIGEKIKKLQLFYFLLVNLEKFRSTELYDASLEGSTIFLYHSSLGRTSMESCRLAELKYAIFRRTGRKTKITALEAFSLDGPSAWAPRGDRQFHFNTAP